MQVLGIDPMQRLVVPAGAGLDAGRGAAQRPGQRRRRGRRLLLQRDHAGRHAGRVPGQLPGAGPAARPGRRRAQGAGLRGGRRAGRLLQGHDRRGRPQGRRRRGQPERGDHLHAAVRAELRASPRSTSRSSRRREPDDADAAAQLDDLGDQLAFYLRAVGWCRAPLRRYRREVVAAAGRGQLRHRRAGRGRRHGRRDLLPDVLHRHRGRAAGLPGARPDRQQRVHRLHLGLLQHPRDLAAGRRRWRCRPRSAAASPPSSARCGSPRRSTRSR